MRSGKGHDGDPITSLSRAAQAIVLDVLEARAERVDLPAQDPLAAPVDEYIISSDVKSTYLVPFIVYFLL